MKCFTQKLVFMDKRPLTYKLEVIITSGRGKKKPNQNNTSQRLLENNGYIAGARESSIYPSDVHYSVWGWASSVQLLSNQ